MVQDPMCMYWDNFVLEISAESFDTPNEWFSVSLNWEMQLSFINMIRWLQ